MQPFDAFWSFSLSIFCRGLAFHAGPCLLPSSGLAAGQEESIPTREISFNRGL
jgi:hypothetical protein